MGDPRAKVDVWPEPNVAKPAGTELVATGIAGDATGEIELNWYKSGVGPAIAQGPRLPYQGPGWYRIEAQIRGHKLPEDGSGVPQGYSRNPATGALSTRLEMDVSRAASGHQKVA